MEQSGFKTGFDIAIEKGIYIEQEVRAIKSFQTIKEIQEIQANKPELKKPDILHDSTTTPTHQISQDKPNTRLDRLSEFSIRILEIIKDMGAVTNRDICNKLNKNNNYVKRYLYNLQNYGFIYRNNETWKWYLLEPYADFLKDLDIIIYNIYNGETKVKEKGNNGETNNIVSPLNNNPEIKINEKKTTQRPHKTKQLNLVDYLQKTQSSQIEGVGVVLSPIENKILMILAAWYDRTEAEATARPYKRYESDYAFAEEIGNSLQEIKPVIAKLDEMGYIYTYPPNKDKYGMWKIGFTEEYLDKVRNR
jgi:transcription initiation factor IIE alpha subunit